MQMRKIVPLALAAVIATTAAATAVDVPSTAPQMETSAYVYHTGWMRLLRWNCNRPVILPECGLPDIDVPDTELPDTDVPDMELPDTDVPDTELPDTDVPDTELPDTDVPDTELPDIDMPDTELPDTDVPDTELPDTDVPDTELPDTDVPDTEIPDAGLPDQTPDQTPDNTPDSTPDQTPGEDDNISQGDYASQVVALVNAERAKYGLSALKVDSRVQQAAQVRAAETVQSFSHTRPNGSSFSTALTEAGVSYTRSGENIAYGQSTPQQVVQAWMNSSGHRANILNGSFTTIGVGYTVVGGTAYWAQLFTA